jgi:hypothetical protein
MTDNLKNIFQIQGSHPSYDLNFYKKALNGKENNVFEQRLSWF